MHIEVLYLKNFISYEKCFCKGCIITAISFRLEPPVQLQIANFKYLVKEMLVLLVHAIGIKQLFFLLLAHVVYIRMAFRGWCQGRVGITNRGKKVEEFLFFLSFGPGCYKTDTYFFLYLLVKSLKW